MDRSYTEREKDDSKMLDENSLFKSNSKPHTLVNGGKLGEKTLILKLIHSETLENGFLELLLRRSRGLDVKIPKQLVSLDDKYLRRCLELVHMNALKRDPCPPLVNVAPFDSRFSSDFDTVGNYDNPITFGTEKLMLSPRDEEIVGTIMGSNSMMRILRGPLFQRLGGSNIYENKKEIPSKFRGSRARFSSPSKEGKESLGIRNERHFSENVLRSPNSISSGMSMINDRCYSSSSFPSESQGMLHFTSDNGILCFTFCLDDQKEVYVANSWKVEGIGDKALDYIYSFHLKSTGPKLLYIPENEPDLIGKMKVSTTFSLSSCNTRIMEIEFVLLGENENHAREMHALSRNNRRSRKLSNVMDVFKGNNSVKRRTPSLFGGSSTIPENFPPEKGSSKPDLSETDFRPNHELVAIVVKDHLKDEDDQNKEVGGWGLKFLKKAKTNSSTNVGDFSTSMDIIVPRGPHGGPSTRTNGPNTRIDGPSGIVERWRSGGKCDCGGWDIGCPLRVFKAKSRKEEGYISFDMFTEFLQGSGYGTPPLKMVNISDGLYFISFQPSTLSALQCFSVAVAIIHSQFPNLRQKHVHDQ